MKPSTLVRGLARKARFAPWILCAGLVALATPVLADEPQAEPAAAPVASPAPAEDEHLDVTRKPETHPGAPSELGSPEAMPKPAPPPTHYLLPDLAPPALIYSGPHFWFKPIFAVVLDYTWISQDAEQVAQSGAQNDTGELRAGRLGGLLRSQGSYKWDFYGTVDYQERKTRDAAVFQLYDLKVGLPIGPVKLDIGKMKEPIAYELSGLSVLLPMHERILLPFYPSRSIGLKLSGYLAGDRMTWAAGAFNDWLDTDVGQGKNGNDYVGRLTGLVWETKDKRDYLHLALGYRRAGSDDGSMRFAGRPESNVIDKIVDTGSFPADHADEISYELLAQHHQFSVLAELIDTKVDSPETGNPKFSGYYITGSWVLTGEGRPYVRAQGNAGGVTPMHDFGSFEVFGRYSNLDMTDGTLDGGVLDKWAVGLNWWISTQWKTSLSWGEGTLDKDGTRGTFNTVLLRLQWLY